MYIQRNISSLSPWNLKHLGRVWKLHLLSGNMHYLSINKEFNLMVKKEFRELMLEFSLCSRHSSDWGLQVFLSVHEDFHTASDRFLERNTFLNSSSLIISIKLICLRKCLWWIYSFFSYYLPYYFMSHITSSLLSQLKYCSVLQYL